MYGLSHWLRTVISCWMSSISSSASSRSMVLMATTLWVRLSIPLNTCGRTRREKEQTRVETRQRAKVKEPKDENINSQREVFISEEKNPHTRASSWCQLKISSCKLAQLAVKLTRGSVRVLTPLAQGALDQREEEEPNWSPVSSRVGTKLFKMPVREVSHEYLKVLAAEEQVQVSSFVSLSWQVCNYSYLRTTKLFIQVLFNLMCSAK